MSRSSFAGDSLIEFQVLSLPRLRRDSRSTINVFGFCDLVNLVRLGWSRHRPWTGLYRIVSGELRHHLHVELTARSDRTEGSPGSKVSNPKVGSLPMLCKIEADMDLGGTTYCSIASYALASRLPALPHQSATIRWLVGRQTAPAPCGYDTDESDTVEIQASRVTRPVAGFQGRIGKDPDACYSFWCKASLRVRFRSPH